MAGRDDVVTEFGDHAEQLGPFDLLGVEVVGFRYIKMGYKVID